MTLEQFNVVLKYAAIASWAIVAGWIAYQIYLKERVK